MIASGIGILLLLPVSYILGCSCYLIALLAAAIVIKRKNSGSNPVAPSNIRLVVAIPAHNEEKVLARTIESLQLCDYPRDLLTIVVIADNCSDQTAAVAHKWGAVVLERQDTSKRGKGYALDFFIAEYLPRTGADAVAFVDADSIVSKDFFAAVSDGIGRGYQAGQVRYTVSNPDEGWRPAMQFISLALKDHVRAVGRQALGCSGGLFGNGMFFSQRLLLEYGWSAKSIVEDVEFASRLIRAATKILYVPDAFVSTLMPLSTAEAQVQKARWEAGQFRMAFDLGVPLVKYGVLRRSLDALLWGVDLLVPPLLTLYGAAGLLLVVSLLGVAVTSNPVLVGTAAVSAASLGTLAAYALGGLKYSRAPRCVWHSLFKLPLYASWKIGLYLQMAIHGAPKEWVRTGR